jgi:hypothetical protein
LLIDDAFDSKDNKISETESKKKTEIFENEFENVGV